MQTSSWVYLKKRIAIHIRQKVQLYLRYADDIFLYRQVLETSYSNLYQKINEVHPSINLEFNYSKTQMHFFTYKKISIEKILTTLYRKKIDHRSYFHGKSEHHKTHKQRV